MKTKSITTTVSERIDFDLEATIQKKDAELKELARKNARHFAKHDRPHPVGDSLPPYVGEIKAGYEKLGADIFKHLQPASHFPEAKIDADHFREKVAKLDEEIKTLEDKNHSDQYELSGYNPGTVPLRMWIAGLATFFIFIGEVVYNTKSFQLITENLLFSLLVSATVSFGVFCASHMVPFMYKEAKTKWKRRLIVICSLVIITIIFIALSYLRVMYLKKHDVELNPGFFVIFNLFFFIVSALISFFLLPTWPEIKQELRHIKTYYKIKKRKKEIQKRKDEKEKIKEIILERTKERMRIGHYANYVADTVRKMYYEAIEIFKGTNLIHRSDRKTPDCFTEFVPEPTIDDVIFTVISSLKK
jgi:hypothetical protein